MSALWKVRNVIMAGTRHSSTRCIRWAADTSQRRSLSEIGGRMFSSQAARLNEEIKKAYNANDLLNLCFPVGPRTDPIRLNAANVSTALLSAARLSKINPKGLREVVERLDEECLKLAPNLSAIQVSSVLVAHARLRSPPPLQLTSALSKRVLKVAAKMQDQQVCNVIWAFAKLKTPPEKEVMTSLMGRAGEVVTGMTPQGVANTLWALGNLRSFADRQVVRCLGQRAGAVADEMAAQHVSNCLWGLATLRPEVGDDAEWLDDLVLGRLAQRMLQIYQSGDSFPRETLTTALWSCAELRMDMGEDLLHVFEIRAEAEAEDMSFKEAVGAFHSIAVLRELQHAGARRGGMEALMKRVHRGVREGLENMPVSMLCEVALAVVSMGVGEGELAREVAYRLAREKLIGGVKPSMLQMEMEGEKRMTLEEWMRGAAG